MNYVFLNHQLVNEYGPLDKQVYLVNSYVYAATTRDWYWVYDDPGKGAVYSRIASRDVPNWAKALLLLIT